MSLYDRKYPAWLTSEYIAGGLSDWAKTGDFAQAVAGVAGLQDFTGGNRRTHLRGIATVTLSEDWGVATQLRTRWFKDSAPERADYFAPGEYAEALGTLVLSRRVRGLRARVTRQARENLLASGAAVELGLGNARRT